MKEADMEEIRMALFNNSSSKRETMKMQPTSKMVIELMKKMNLTMMMTR